MAPRRSVPQAERRQELLAAARDVFTRKGYHAATVDDITRAAGVAKGTFYLYFDEKREVFSELVRGFLEQIGALVRSVASGTPDDFMDRARQAAHDLMRLFLDNREMARLAYRESMGLDRELETMVRAFYRDIAEIEAANVRRGIELGVFRSVNPLVVAYAHIGMVERVLLELLDEDTPLPPPDVIVGEVLGLALEGLLRR